MTTDDRARTTLHERLEAALGADAADTLMGYLPPVGWSEVTTRRDLEAATVLMRTELHTEIGALRNEMATEFAAVRNEMTTEFAAVRNEMTTGFAATEARFDRFEARIERALRQTVLAMVTIMIAMVGGALALRGIG